MAHEFRRNFQRWALALLLPACAREPSRIELVPASRTVAAPTGTLTTYGSLSDLMQLGQTGPSVWLRKMSDDPALVGLGALSGLRGEVAVIDGKVWLGYATDATTTHGRVLDGADETAAFLAVASVPEWRTITLEAAIPSAALDRMLIAQAEDMGLDVRRPLPVVITGGLRNLRFHVADGRGLKPGEPVSEKELLITASKGWVAASSGVLVGFFSAAPQPALLHAEDRHHLHVVLKEKPEVAHVDQVDLDPGAVVRLPPPQR